MDRSIPYFCPYFVNTNNTALIIFRRLVKHRFTLPSRIFTVDISYHLVVITPAGR